MNKAKARKKLQLQVEHAVAVDELGVVQTALTKLKLEHQALQASFDGLATGHEELQRTLTVERKRLATEQANVADLTRVNKYLGEEIRGIQKNHEHKDARAEFFNTIDSMACAAIGKNALGIGEVIERMNAYRKTLVFDGRYRDLAFYWKDAIARMHVLFNQADGVECFVGTWISDQYRAPTAKERL